MSVPYRYNQLEHRDLANNIEVMVLTHKTDTPLRHIREATHLVIETASRNKNIRMQQ